MVIELLLAFLCGSLPVSTIFLVVQSAHSREQRAAAIERDKLLDRVQSPDMVAYYAARAAWHPEDTEQQQPEPMPDYAYTEEGFYVGERVPEAEE